MNRTLLVIRVLMNVLSGPFVPTQEFRSPDENNLPVRPTGKKEFVGNWRIESGVQSVGVHFLQFPTNSFFARRVVHMGLGEAGKSGPFESVLIFGCLPTRKAVHEMGRRLV